MFVRARSGIYVPIAYLEDEKMVIDLLNQVRNYANARLVDHMKGTCQNAQNAVSKHIVKPLSNYAFVIR